MYSGRIKCSVKQSLIGLHNEVMSLSTLRTPISDDDQQIIVSITGQMFFCSVQDGIFNLVTSFTDLVEFGRLHSVIDENKISKSRWERNMRQYAHHAEPLFNKFTSVEARLWVQFVRNIDARGWELHLRDPKSSGNQTKYLSHGGSFIQACEAGEMDIVNAMVDRTQVDLEARSDHRRTPPHLAALYGHLPLMQYMCGQGADKEARDNGGSTALH